MINDNNSQLSLADFDFDVPEHLVAQHPRPQRDSSRLLIRTPEGALKHACVTDLKTALPPNTLLILNDTRVFPSRMFGNLSSGGSIEVFLLEPINAPQSGECCAWLALGRPMKKLKLGTAIRFAEGLVGEVIGRHEDTNGQASLEILFYTSSEKLAEWLDLHGKIPLPPYIKRPKTDSSHELADRKHYQTVYAEHTGSIAAPTAGLHFTPNLLGDLKRIGINIKFVSLHVGAGTFLPVKTQNVSFHKMHFERYKVGRDTAQAIVQARKQGTKIVAVGTTSLRSLESLYRRGNGDTNRFVELAEEWNTTDLFIHPQNMSDSYKPWVIDGLMTNFHQPCSTLFMLIAALLGLNNAKQLYSYAIANEYRLFSYGDANLLWL